jgi:hypothetical protein
VRITHVCIEPVALRVRARLVIEGEERAVANDWIGGGSEDTIRVAVGPDYVSRGFRHARSPKKRPRMGSRGQVKRGTKQAMCEQTASLIMVNQPLTHSFATAPAVLAAGAGSAGGSGEVERWSVPLSRAGSACNFFCRENRPINPA